MNLADVGINVGVVMMIIGMVIGGFESYGGKGLGNGLGKVEGW